MTMLCIHPTSTKNKCLSSILFLYSLPTRQLSFDPLILSPHQPPVLRYSLVDGLRSTILWITTTTIHTYSIHTSETKIQKTVWFLFSCYNRTLGVETGLVYFRREKWSEQSLLPTTSFLCFLIFYFSSGPI